MGVNSKKKRKRSPRKERERAGVKPKGRGWSWRGVGEGTSINGPSLYFFCRAVVFSHLISHTLFLQKPSLFSPLQSPVQVFFLFFLIYSFFTHLTILLCHFLAFFNIFPSIVATTFPKVVSFLGFCFFFPSIFLLKIKKLFFWMGFCCYFLKSLHFTFCPFCFLLLGFLLSWICSVQALFFYINLHGYIRTFQLPFVFEKLLILIFVCVVFSMISEIGFQIIWLGWDR